MSLGIFVLVVVSSIVSFHEFEGESACKAAAEKLNRQYTTAAFCVPKRGY